MATAIVANKAHIRVCMLPAILFGHLIRRKNFVDPTSRPAVFAMDNVRMSEF